MLVDPHGHVLSSDKRVVRFQNPALARVAASADEAFRMLHLTVVCLDCGATPTMQNHPSDAQWAMECGCMRRVLVNPGQQH